MVFFAYLFVSFDVDAEESQAKEASAAETSDPSKVQIREKAHVWSCFFLVKKKIFGIFEDVHQTLSQIEGDDLKVYKLMIADMFGDCLLKMSVDDAVEVINIFFGR